jgi:hypothetical protein
MAKNFDTGLAVMRVTFSTANALSAKLLGGAPRFDVTIVGGHIVGAQGTSIG